MNETSYKTVLMLFHFLSFQPTVHTRSLVGIYQYSSNDPLGQFRLLQIWLLVLDFSIKKSMKKHRWY